MGFKEGEKPEFLASLEKRRVESTLHSLVRSRAQRAERLPRGRVYGDLIEQNITFLASLLGKDDPAIGSTVKRMEALGESWETGRVLFVDLMDRTKKIFRVNVDDERALENIYLYELASEQPIGFLNYFLRKSLTPSESGGSKMRNEFKLNRGGGVETFWAHPHLVHLLYRGASWDEVLLGQMINSELTTFIFNATFYKDIPRGTDAVEAVDKFFSGKAMGVSRLALPLRRKLFLRYPEHILAEAARCGYVVGTSKRADLCAYPLDEADRPGTIAVGLSDRKNWLTADKNELTGMGLSAFFGILHELTHLKDLRLFCGLFDPTPLTELSAMAEVLLLMEEIGGWHWAGNKTSESELARNFVCIANGKIWQNTHSLDIRIGEAAAMILRLSNEDRERVVSAVKLL